MAEEITRTPQSDPVAESVRRALQLVGPAESGAEGIWDDEVRDSPAS